MPTLDHQLPPGRGATVTTPGARTTGIDLLILGLFALVIRIPAFLSSRSLVFDDGVFGASVVAMRSGGAPFREVFSSQGPLFLPLAWFGDLLTLRTPDSPRSLAVISGIVIALATYLAGRELTTRARAFLAAGLVVVSGSVLWTTAPLAADGPASALAVIAVTLALIYRRSPSIRRAIVIGILVGAAFSVKSLLVLPALVTVGILVVSRRRRRDIVTVPIIAAVVTVVASLPWGIARVLEQSVLYHTDAIGERAPLQNLETVARALVTRDLPIVVAGVVAIAAWLWRGFRRRASAKVGEDRDAVTSRADGWIERLGAGRVPVVVWTLLVAFVLITENPLWRSHVAHLIPPLALLIATARVGWRTIAIAAVAAVPVSVVSLQPLLLPSGPNRAEATVEAAIRTLPPRAMVISDTPGIVWRSGRRTPDRYVDTSILRITSPRQSIRITEDDVVRDAASPRVCGVLSWSEQRFGSFTGLGPRLRRLGYAAKFIEPRSSHSLWLKARCRPQGPPPAAWPARADRTNVAVAPDRSPD